MQQENKRTEHDILGDLQIDNDSLVGIHSCRAFENFGRIGGVVNEKLLRAYGLVKLASLQVNTELGYIDKQKADVIEKACIELAEGKLRTDCRLAALQGGAGTSTNMYVNEIIANRALQLSGKNCGDYQYISPLNDVNKHQSTNDTYPTALRIAAIKNCRRLEEAVGELAVAFEKKEKQFADIVKIGRTELQQAVPITVGKEMGAYAEALNKDRWRLYKCHERLRVVNLGGTAVGTGIGAPQKYIFKATEKLNQLTNLGLARAENLVQATQNCDDFVEVSGILKALASNLLKIARDLRLLSGLAGEIELPVRQAGSSIMAGKVNPVIAEMVCQAAMQAFARDYAITIAASGGELELNAFMPLIAENLLAMTDELIIAVEKMKIFLVDGIEANRENCEQNLHSTTAVITAVIKKIGYDKAAEIVKKATAQNKTVKEILIEEKLCSQEEYRQMTSPQAVNMLGFRQEENTEK